MILRRILSIRSVFLIPCGETHFPLDSSRTNKTMSSEVCTAIHVPIILFLVSFLFSFFTLGSCLIAHVQPESLESSSSSGSYETASDLPPVSHRYSRMAIFRLELLTRSSSRASMSRSGHLSSSTHTRSTVVSSTHASSKASHSEPYSAMEEEDSDDKVDRDRGISCHRSQLTQDISKAEACFRTVVCCGSPCFFYSTLYFVLLTGRNPLLTIFLSLAVVLASSVVVHRFIGFGKA